jgi:hypothetical protein
MIVPNSTAAIAHFPREEQSAEYEKRLILPLPCHLQVIGRKWGFLKEKGNKKMVGGQQQASG